VARCVYTFNIENNRENYHVSNDSNFSRAANTDIGELKNIYYNNRTFLIQNALITL